MALQVFSAGQTLTATQMNTLQASTYNYPLLTVSATTYTISSTDAGHIVTFTSNADPVEVTIPNSLNVDDGDTIDIIYAGTGSLSLVPGSSVTLYSEGSMNTIVSQWARVSLLKIAADEYIISWMTAITESEIVDGSVTSSKLAENLSLTGTTKIQEIMEDVYMSALPLGPGTDNLYVQNGGVHYYTLNASADWVWNISGASGTALNSIMEKDKAITVAAFVSNGPATTFSPTNITIDTSATVDVLWFGGNAYPDGSADSTDAYTFSIIKTANNTFKVFANQSRFS